MNDREPHPSGPPYMIVLHVKIGAGPMAQLPVFSWDELVGAVKCATNLAIQQQTQPLIQVTHGQKREGY